MTHEHPYIELLKRYEQVSNLHDIEACLASFSPDGMIVAGSETYQGERALRDAHEYDEASRTRVKFSDFEIEGNSVRCVFWNQHVLSRVLGSDGMTAKADWISARRAGQS